jgi:hypothetical protein
VPRRVLRARPRAQDTPPTKPLPVVVYQSLNVSLALNAIFPPSLIPSASDLGKSPNAPHATIVRSFRSSILGQRQSQAAARLTALDAVPKYMPCSNYGMTPSCLPTSMNAATAWSTCSSV